MVRFSGREGEQWQREYLPSDGQHRGSLGNPNDISENVLVLEEWEAPGRRANVALKAAKFSLSVLVSEEIQEQAEPKTYDCPKHALKFVE